MGKFDYKKLLNAQQYAAVSSGEGHSLIIAGAGSGKTHTLTYRVAWLLEHGVLAGEILLLTFTNKAAKQMQHRVAALLPGQTEGLWAGTFHSICRRILKRFAVQLGYSSNFSILDSDDSQQLLGHLIRDAIKADKHLPKAGVLLGIYSYAANTCQSIEKVVSKRYAYLLKHLNFILKAHEAYVKAKLAGNSMDFDDLLVNCVNLLEQHADIGRLVSRQFRHVLVDEYQDTNKLQSKLVDLLSCEHGNLMVVGDDAQSIYAWRGAEVQNILGFGERYANAALYKIESNYRSFAEILGLANSLIINNKMRVDKHLNAERGSKGQLAKLVICNSDRGEAGYVAEQIAKYMAEGVPANQIAVLYRSHFHSLFVQSQLSVHKIPYNLSSGVRFFEQAHIKDVVAYLRLLVNCNDRVAFYRIVTAFSGIGEVGAGKLWQQFALLMRSQQSMNAQSPQLLAQMKLPAKAAEDWQLFLELLSEFFDEQGQLQTPDKIIQSLRLGYYDDLLQHTYDNANERMDDVVHLQMLASNHSGTAEFLDEINLLGDEQSIQQRKAHLQDAVSLSTIHQAKGLEWKVVFVIGVNEGFFPNADKFKNPELELQEERRLLYVAMTRAMDDLHICYNQISSMRQSGGLLAPSRFIQELPQHDLEVVCANANTYRL